MNALEHPYHIKEQALGSVVQIILELDTRILLLTEVFAGYFGMSIATSLSVEDQFEAVKKLLEDFRQTHLEFFANRPHTDDPMHTTLGIYADSIIITSETGIFTSRETAKKLFQSANHLAWKDLANADTRSVRMNTPIGDFFMTPHDEKEIVVLTHIPVEVIAPALIASLLNTIPSEVTAKYISAVSQRTR